MINRLVLTCGTNDWLYAHHEMPLFLIKRDLEINASQGQGYNPQKSNQEVANV